MYEMSQDYRTIARVFLCHLTFLLLASRTTRIGVQALIPIIHQHQARPTSRFTSTCLSVSIDDTRPRTGISEEDKRDDDDDDNNNGNSKKLPSTIILPPPLDENKNAADRFHQDMRRVLESRHHFLDEYLDKNHRRNRPIFLPSDVDGAERVLSMLRHLQSIQAANEESFQIVMGAFLRRDRMRWRQYSNSDDHDRSDITCAADQLEQLLEELTDIVPRSSISMDTYNLVLEAYAVCSTARGDNAYAFRALQLLERMEATFGEVPAESMMHVLHAYAWQQANLREGKYASKANELLERIEEKTRDALILMQCYDWVIEAWSKSGSEGSAEKAQALLSKMKSLNETLSDDNDDLARQILDAESYSNAILAWSKSSEEGAAEKSSELLMEMIKQYNAGAFPEGSEPPLIAFNGVITSWGRMGRPEKAEEILLLLEDQVPLCDDLVPHTLTYNSVLNAYFRSSNKAKALEKAIELVEYMENAHKDQPAIRPNSFSFVVFMKTWIQSSSPNVAEECEKLLITIHRLWEEGDRSVEPTNRVFNMVINAYAKSNHPAAARKALDLLNRMKESKLCLPDKISYTSVLECVSKSSDPNAPKLAESLLEDAFDLYKTTKDPAHMPNLRTFTMAILTFAKNHGSAERARSLLEQLLELYEETMDAQLRPNAYPYNYVLDCAANSLEDRPEAFRIATQTYQEMRKSAFLRPDSFTYAFWLKCCNNLLPRNELRAKCVSYSFEECKKEGLVSNQVITRLFQGSPPEMVRKLLELDSDRPLHRVQVDALPPSWSRNAAKKR